MLYGVKRYCSVSPSDTIGKMMERVIYHRLLPIVESNNVLPNRKCCCRRSYSTVDTISMVVNLTKYALSSDPLRGKTTLWYEKEVSRKECIVTTEMPQDSVLGPLLWNVLYNGALIFCRPWRSYGFANNQAVVIVEHLEDVEIYATEAVMVVKD